MVLGPHKVEVFKGKNGNWFWRSRARNGRIIATSGEGYERKQHALDMCAAMFKDVPFFTLDEDEE